MLAVTSQDHDMLLAEKNGRPVDLLAAQLKPHRPLRFGADGPRIWIDQRFAGQGTMPRAVAMVMDYCFFTVGLHRVEINIRPENAASLRVAHKLQLREEGLRIHYLHIDGKWCDHRSFALTAEERPGGVLATLLQQQHGRQNVVNSDGE